MKAGSILLVLLTLPIISFSQTASPSEKPSDVEILKFSWAEAQPKTTVFSSRSSGNVFDASGSGSGRTDTVRADSDRVNDRIPPEAKAPKVKITEFIFALSIKNTGGKIIQNIRWGYFLHPKDQTAEAVGWLFETKTKIEPGQKKGLQDRGILMGELLSKMKKPINRSSFNDKVVILHIDYSDGSTWDNPSTYPNIQIFPSHKD